MTGEASHMSDCVAVSSDEVEPKAESQACLEDNTSGIPPVELWPRRD